MLYVVFKANNAAAVLLAYWNYHCKINIFLLVYTTYVYSHNSHTFLQKKNAGKGLKNGAFK